MNEMKKLEINAEEIEYLSQKFEIRDSRDLFAWGIKLLYDIAKFEEEGWIFTLQKGKIDQEVSPVQMNMNPNYRILGLLLEWLAPTTEMSKRLPNPKEIEEHFKIDKTL